LNIAILTKEYPPYIYGGAGAHVEYLVRELRKLDSGGHEIQILCFGDQEQHSRGLHVRGLRPFPNIGTSEHGHRTLLDTLQINVAMVGALEQADVIHCHTWYTHLAGCLLKEMLGAPLVLTTHSLEPRRPWKREQLGKAYHASSWMEKTAYENADGVIAVSESMRQDVHGLYHVPMERIEVIHNGIDDDLFCPREDPSVLSSYGIDGTRPYLLMVARLTRQKGILPFLEAVKYLRTGVQVVMCASVPDTTEFMEEVSAKSRQVKEQSRNDLIWVKETVPREDLVVLYSCASLFVCPSVYEPFGIINLEAMACGTPVVASRVGGIKEVVVEGETGRLVSFERVSSENPEPKDPERFARDLAQSVNEMLASPGSLKAMGVRARQRVKDHFSWGSIARKTLDFYKRLVVSLCKAQRAME
jgi:alpha-maltose-1-phosphate synthase